jgi:hypothetical protein
MCTVDGFGFIQNPIPDITMTERLSKTGAEDVRERGGYSVCCMHAAMLKALLYLQQG